MTTLNQLVDQVSNALHSFTTQEQLTWLTTAVTDSDLSLVLADGEQVSRGIVEIDDELVYVSSVDTATNTATVAPFGRGFRGSTAAAHSANAKVTFDPHFPRVEVKRAINETLAAIYPRLYAIKETTFTFTGAQATWELPAEADEVVKVQFEVTGPSLYWAPLSTWEFDPNAETVSGKSITLHEAPLQSSTVKVIYRAPFGTLSDATELSTIGFPESATDVLKLGASSRLVQYLDVSRLVMSSVENFANAQFKQAGDPVKLANQFYAMFMTRLEEERRKLLELNPPQMHFTR